MDTKTFCSRTERKIHEHPGIDGVNIIGLDMGYSSPKGFHKGGNFCFPNFVQELNKNLFGDLDKNQIIYEDLSSGRRYCVGDMAIKQLGQDSVVSESAMFGRNHYNHPDFLVVTRTALAFALWENSDTDGADLFIQTGLPPAYLSEDSEYLIDVFDGHHDYRVTIGRETKEFHYSITRDQVDIIYQPVGTLHSIGFNRDGKPTQEFIDYSKANIVIFDGGFGTLDKFYIRNRIIEEMDTNPRLGMRRVLEETAILVRKETGINISINGMQNCLKNGEVQKVDRRTLRTKSYDITPYFEKANDLVCREAFDSITDNIIDAKYLIMTGGTGAAWYGTFRELLKELPVTVVPGNQNSGLPCIYSNARGYYMYRLHKIRTERRKRG